MSADVLPPGGEGQIKVTLTPKGNHEDIVKHITVLSDDPKQPRFALTMKGKLAVDVRAEPSSVNFPEQGPGEAGTASLRLVLNEPEQVALTRVTLEDPEAPFELHALARASDDGPGVHRYELRFTGAKTVGSFATRVVVTTDGEHTPTLHVPVRARVTGNLRHPQHLRFIERDGAIASRQLRITSRDGQPPAITRIEDRGGLLVLDPREPQPGAQVIDVGVDAEAWAAIAPERRTEPRVLVLHTRDPDQPKLEIRYAIGPAGRARPGSSGPAKPR